MFAVDTGNAGGEGEEHMGWERCVDGVTGEFSAGDAAGNWTSPPRTSVTQNGAGVRSSVTNSLGWLSPRSWDPQAFPGFYEIEGEFSSGA